MSQKFKCKHKGCNKTVVYEPTEVPAFYSYATNAVSNKKKSIYLTCENGHTHKYYVTVEE